MDVYPEDVVTKGRLQPGRMLLVDTKQGQQRAVEAYEPLLRRLEQYTTGLNMKVHAIPVSLKSGENCLQVRDLLLRKAVFKK